MFSGDNVFSRFQTWLDFEAPADPSLEGLVKQVTSEEPLQAMWAYIRLLCVFLWNRWQGKIAKTDVRHEFKQKTTNEIALDVLKDIEAKPAEAEPEPMPVDRQAIAPPEPPASAESALARPDIAKEFLEQMREQTKRRDAVLDEETTRLRRREDTVFRAFLYAASLTIGIIVIGVVLIFLNLVALGVVSGVVGLLPGAGTIILNRLSQDVKTQRQQLLEQRDDNLKVLQAIQATLIIPDPNRQNEAMASLAAKLADQALKSTLSPARGRP